jgi:NADPH-dependent 2,4-dienoyl-CoA reductase/sulfur reductase-like enzyme
VERVRLDDGTVLEADVVVLGIGVEPATEWLANSGLDTANGIRCDAALLAVGSEGTIAAAGDLARWPYPRYGDEPMRVEHWANAVESAYHAARALVHGAEAAGGYEPDLYFWTMQHGVHVQSVGMPTAGDEVVVVDGSEEERSFAAVVGRDGRAVGAVAFDRQSAFTNVCRPAVAAAAPLAGLGA